MIANFPAQMTKEKPEPRNIVGRQVAALRNERGMSQSDLATACQLSGWDISRETLAKLESGIRWVADSELLLLAKALKVKVVNLYPPEHRKLIR